jgi:SAM-dependent methyltransferase
LDTKKFIFLPGSVYQVNKFLEDTIIEEKDILIIGANSEAIAEELLDSKARSVIIIVDDNDTLIRSRFILSGKRRISTRMMEYTNTDFSDAAFDIVYAQASISTPARKKILKEIKRILRPDGLLCSGEIVNLEKEVPKFINDLRENSGIEALWINELNDFYIKAGFEIVSEENLSNRLQNFYRDSSRLLEENKDDLTEQEKSYYKKTLKMMSHEPNAYLELGGFKFMGLKMLIARKPAQ